MLSEQSFIEGVDVIANTFNRKVSNAAIKTWYSFLQSKFTARTWFAAVRATVAEEESFPHNFIRALASRAPRPASSELSIPINPDTGRTYTDQDATRNVKRLHALMQIMADKNSPVRERLVQIHSEQDSGQEIINILSAALNKQRQLEEAPF